MKSQRGINMRDGYNHQSDNYLRRQEKFKNIRTKPAVVAGLDVKYHSTQINLDDCVSEKDYRFSSAVGSLPDEAIYEKHPYQTDWIDGRERKPHITVLYGLVNASDYFDIRKVCKAHGPIEFQIGPVKAFRNAEAEHDVLVHEILSESLHQLNAALSNFENENSYPDYKPHMTLSYVKKGALAELEGQGTSLTGETFTANKIVFSHLDGYTLELPLV